MELVRRWRAYGRQYGGMGLFRHLLVRAVRLAWETSSVQILAATPPVEPVASRVPVQIKLLQAGQVHAKTSDWAARWETGHVCYAVWVDGKLAHYSWVSFQDTYIGEVHTWLRLAASEAYIYDCYTDAAYRGLGIFPAVLTYAQAQLFQQGIHRIWIAVEPENRSSLKPIMRAGFRLVGEAGYRRAGPWVSRSLQAEPGAEGPPIEP